MPSVVRGILHVFAIVILATSSAAGDPRYAISVAEPLKLVFHHRYELAEPCGTRKSIYGCTAFREEHLECSCEQAGNRWRLHASAHFLPIFCLYERRTDVIDHERLHIDDVRAMLERYLQQLTERDFGTEERCAREAQEVSKRFILQMNEFRQKSNDKLN